MKKQTVTAVSTDFLRVVFLLAVPLLLGPAMHQALGQGNAGKRSAAANFSQVAPPSTGAITGTYAPANPAPLSRLVAPTAPATCSWIARTVVPYNARGIFAASDGFYVYAGGGYDGVTAYADLLRFDPVANSWTPLAPSPDAHFLSQAVYDNGKIYNMGGFAPNPSNTTRIYTIGTDTWTTGAAMPDTLADQATALWNGIIYVAGGFNGSGVVSTLYAYNIASDSWSTLAPMPQGVYEPGFGVINGKLYIASGRHPALLNTLQIYDIATNTWTTGATVPLPVLGPGSTVFNGQLYLYGGLPTGTMTTTATQIYDPVSNSWSAGPNMNVNRFSFYGTAVGSGSIVAPGGEQNQGTPINDNEQLTGCGTPVPSGAVSRKVHGGAGPFDIPLPLVPISGAVGIEDRTGPVAGAHQMVITFPSAVTVTSAAVTSGVGMVASFSGSGSREITVNLTGVTDAQRLGVTLMNVNDSVLAGDVLIPMGLLAGDTNASGAVSAADVAQTKAQSGSPVVAGNFREDVNASGSVNAGDVALVKSKAGNILPP